jgi:hypothetical protein
MGADPILAGAKTQKGFSDLKRLFDSLRGNH